MIVSVLAAALWAAAGAGAQQFSARLPPTLPSPAASAASAASVSAVPAAPGLVAPALAPSLAAPIGGPAPLPSAAAAPAAWSFRETEAAAEAADARRFQTLQQALDARFDGARLRPEQAHRAVVAAMAAPLRTANQLAQLSQAPRAEGEKFRFVVIGDAEPGRFWVSRTLFNRDTGAFWRLLRRADRAGADFIVQLGDMVSRGTWGNFFRFFTRLRAAALRTPYLTVIGNHDRHKPHGVTNARVYRSLFGTTDYTFTRGGWRFVVVDSSAGRLTKAQLEWLDATLTAGEPTIVFTHMPPSPLGEWTDYGTKGAGGFRLGAEEFMRLMSERRVSRVYMGHVHAFGTLDRGGVRYVLTGGGGSPLFPGPVKDRFHHSITVEVGPDGVNDVVEPLGGRPFSPR